MNDWRRNTMKNLTTLILTVFLSLSLMACDTNKAMNLKNWDKVYVLIEPSSLDLGITPDQAGTSKVEDIKMKYVYAETNFGKVTGPALIVYSDLSSVPKGSVYMAMRVWQSYDAAIKDEKAIGIHVNYQSKQMTPYAVKQEDLEEAMANLNHEDPIKFNVSMMF